MAPSGGGQRRRGAPFREASRQKLRSQKLRNETAIAELAHFLAVNLIVLVAFASDEYDVVFARFAHSSCDRVGTIMNHPRLPPPASRLPAGKDAGRNYRRRFTSRIVVGDDHHV